MDNARLERYAELSQFLHHYRRQGLSSTARLVKEAAYEMASLLRAMTPEEKEILHQPVNRRRVVLTGEVSSSRTQSPGKLSV